ncbi:MAG: hypothetical protein IMF09_12820 [Proteobacteria bacterium]|nr:hypothetical protein [Pseudomonadota bacterium]
MILLRGWGSWSSATVRLQVSDDGSNYQNLTDEKGYAVGLFGDNFATLIPMPTGVTFRVVIADTGSPESSLTIRASGDIGA